MNARLTVESGAAGGTRPVGKAPSAASLRHAPVADPATVKTGGIARALSQSPPIDQAKVAALKHAVQTASYSVDPQKIAEAMVRSLKD